MSYEPAGNKASSSPGHSGPLAAIGALIVAALAGIFRHADDLARPLARYGDDAARAAARHADTFGPPVAARHAGSVDDFATPFAQRIPRGSDSFPSLVPGGQYADDAVTGGRAVQYSHDAAETSENPLAKVFKIALEESLEAGAKQSAERLAQGPPVGDEQVLAQAPGKQDERKAAEKMTFIITDTSADLQESYALEDDGYFYVTRTRSVQKQKVTLAGVEVAAEESIETDLPDRKKGELSRRKLTKNKAGVAVLVEHHWFLMEEKLVKLESEGEVEFTAGDWDRFTAGKAVTVRYTAQGLKRAAEEVRQQAEPQFAVYYQKEFGDKAKITLEFPRVPNETIVIEGKSMESKSDGVLEMKWTIVAEEAN